MIETLTDASPAPQVQQEDLTHLHGARRAGLHHLIVYGDTAYDARSNAGLVMMEASDRSSPTLITHWNWSPPFRGGTHTCLPLSDEADYVAKGKHFGPHNLYEKRPNKMVSDQTVFATH